MQVIQKGPIEANIDKPGSGYTRHVEHPEVALQGLWIYKVLHARMTRP